MRVLKNIWSQLHRFVFWALLSTILWAWIFTLITDTVPEKKVTLYVQTENCRSMELTLKLEEEKPEGIKMVKVHPFSYAVFGDQELLEAQKAATMAGLYGSGSTGGSGRSNGKSGSGRSGSGGSGSGSGAGGNEGNGEKRFFEQDLSDAVRAFGLVKDIVQIPGTTTNTLMGTDADGDKHKIIINKETGIAEVVY